MAYEIVKSKKKIKNKAQLCWSCQHSVPNGINRGCSWSNFLKPVPGWDADECWVKYTKAQKIKGYTVKHCPKYLHDERFADDRDKENKAFYKGIEE